MDALILAGGKGSRLAPWPAPKALLPINGVPTIQRLLDHVSPHVERTIVCIGYRGRDVRAALRGEPRISFSDAGGDAPMGARLLVARREWAIDGRAIVLYGDEIANVDIPALVGAHEQSGADLTFTAWQHVLPFGVVEGAQIVERSVYMNIGFVVADPAAWEFIRAEDGLSDWVNRVAKRSCFIHPGKRSTVNTLVDLRAAEKVWA